MVLDWWKRSCHGSNSLSRLNGKLTLCCSCSGKKRLECNPVEKLREFMRIQYDIFVSHNLSPCFGVFQKRGIGGPLKLWNHMTIVVRIDG